MTVRDLRLHGDEIIDRVVDGETLTVTRDGRPVAELRPVRRPGPSAEALLITWRRPPAVDVARFRADLDETIDSKL